MTLQSQMVLYLCLVNLEAAKHICQAKNCSAQCFKAWYAAHITACLYTIVWSISCNDIVKVLKFSCSVRDRFHRKNTLITSAVGSLKVCLKYAGFTFTHFSCGGRTFFVAGAPTINSTSHN